MSNPVTMWADVPDHLRYNLVTVTPADVRCHAAVRLDSWYRVRFGGVGWKRCAATRYRGGDLCWVHRRQRDGEDPRARLRAPLKAHLAMLSALRPAGQVERMAVRAWFELGGGADAFATLVPVL